MNAAVRLYANKARSIQSVSSQLVRVATSANVARFFGVFDRADAMPEMRASLHAERYADTPQLDGATVSALVRAHGQGVRHLPAREQPVDYKQMFTPGPAKKLAWSLFAAGAWHECVRRRRSGLVAELYYPNGASAVVGKNGEPGRYHREIAALGEADLACFEIAAREATAGRAVMVRSVDTDLILQTVASGQRAGVPFVPTKPFHIRLKGFTVDGRKLIARFGGADPSHRLSAAFWMIMAGGTDYSKPASDQGYYKKDMAALSLKRSRVMTVSAAGRVQLRVLEVKGMLAALKRRKVKSTRKAGKAGVVLPRSLRLAIAESARSACYYGGYCSTGKINMEWSMHDAEVAII